MFDILKAKNARINEAAEGFGQLFDEYEFEKIYVLTADGTASITAGGTPPAIRSSLICKRGYSEYNFKGISPGQRQRVLFKPLSGILNQNKFLPIRYMPLTFELELVNNATEPVFSSFTTEFSSDISAANTSIEWQIENPEIKVDLISLDNALDNTYARHLLEGKSLPINYNTFVSQQQSIQGQQKPSVNVSRALTRLKSVFVTLNKDLTQDKLNMRPGLKPWSLFWSPMSLENDDAIAQDNSRPTFDEKGEFKFYVQIGSKMYPEYPMRSHSEAYSQLKKTLGIQSSNVHSFDINAKEYRDHKLILATDCEKVLDAGWTGLNTRAGDLMRVTLEYNSTEAARLADQMHIVLHSDQIVEIRDTGIQIFD
jgi:hypothetical protein